MFVAMKKKANLAVYSSYFLIYILSFLQFYNELLIFITFRIRLQVCGRCGIYRRLVRKYWKKELGKDVRFPEWDG